MASRNENGVNSAGNSKNVSRKTRVCRFFAKGNCKFGSRCRFLHVMETNEDKSPPRTTRFRVQQEALSKSKDKMCGICFDKVLEKSNDNRFGLLPNCNHCFCLSCLGKWRQAKPYDLEVTRGCPECRTKSTYVVPSRYWPDSTQSKDKIISDYKENASKKPCKYFKQGAAHCPFGNQCFYLHALPCGKKVDVGQPRPRQYNRTRRNMFTDPFEIFDEAMFFDPLDEIYTLAEELDTDLFFTDDEYDDGGLSDFIFESDDMF